MSRLLTTGNPKTQKGAALGWHTAILHLAPASLSGRNLCPWSSEGCRRACLNTAGRGGIYKAGEQSNAIQRARIARAQWFIDDRAGFLAQLSTELDREERKARAAGLQFAARLNGTADLPWEAIAPDLFRRHRSVRFYDYTKGLHRVRGTLPPNYVLTVSRSETNEPDLAPVLASQTNVAVVFDALPAEYLGRPVVNGDASDLRFLDPPGVVVGLTAKGRAKGDRTGFVVRRMP